MKILVMNQPCTRAARKHPALEGRKLIGCGQFSAVFEGSRPDTIHKLTIDPAAYWLFNDGVVGVHGQHFPKTVADYSEVGEVTIHANLRAGRPRRVPIFLYEQERLLALPIKSEQRKLAKSIIDKTRASANTRPKCKGVRRDVDSAQMTLEDLSAQEDLPASVRDAAGDLARFCNYYDDLFLDMHFGNFMVRPDSGELVFSDPFGCSSIFRGHQNYD